MADSRVYNFRFNDQVRERMAALAEARDLTMTDALHEAAMEWIVREELRQAGYKKPSTARRSRSGGTTGTT